MKIRLLAAALAFCTALTLSSCAKQADGYTSAQGSVGATQDDALVFAADTDTDQIYVFDTVTEQRVAAVKVGASPEKVLVGKDDTLFVTNKMGRSISVIRCRLEEGTDGQMLVSNSRQPFNLSDPCVGRGRTLAYHADAHSDALKAVTEFVTATLRSK